MAPSPIKILDLASLVDRPVVVIDGHEYELFTFDLLPAMDASRIRRWSACLDALALLPEPTEADEQEAIDLSDRICRVVLDAPGDIHEKLTQRQRSKIFEAFLLAPAVVIAQREAIQHQSPTGASSPPASPGSTEAAP